MNKKSIRHVMAFAMAVIGSAVSAHGGTIAYFPFDEDAYSIVNTECNPSSILSWSQTSAGYEKSIRYLADMESYVCDKNYRAIRSGRNLGYLELDHTRLVIDMNKFALSNDVDSITFEFFVKGYYSSDPEKTDIANWGGKLVFGAGNMAYDSAGAGNCIPRIYLQNDNGTPWFGVRTSTTEKYGKGGSFNGTWNHVAVTIAPNASGGSTANFWFNYSLKATYDFPDKWTGMAGAGTYPMYLVLNHISSGKLCFDELRISEGVLDESQFIRRASWKYATPEEGETLYHLPFDGDLMSIVRTDEDVGYKRGGYSFVASDGRDGIAEYGSQDTLCRTNTSCLSVASTNVWIRPSLYCMQTGRLDRATVEFFVKGDPANETTWTRVLVMGYPSTGQYGIYCQISGSRTLFIKAGAGTTDYAYTSSASLTDGAWHHVAMTVAPIDGGTRSHVEFFIDYQPVYSHDTAVPWNGLGISGGEFQLGGNKSFLQFDELRVTYGVLPVSKFLARTRISLPSGLSIIFR